MSGPKVSVYRLSREIQLALQKEIERQLQERAKKLREEQEKEKARQLAIKKEQEQARMRKLDQEQQKVILGEDFSSLFGFDNQPGEEEKPDQEKYQESLKQYEILCQLTGNQQPAMISFGVGAVEQLQKEIQKEKRRLLQQKEERYIKDTIEQTIEEMGYSVLGKRHVSKRSGQQVTHELYQYGEDTGIDVTYGENGQIAIELGKLDHQDRLPSTEECLYLENQMIAFCGDFQTLECRLRDKGIFIGKRVLLAPPSADFAQVINQTEYTSAVQTQMAEQKKQRKKNYDTIN